MRSHQVEDRCLMPAMAPYRHLVVRLRFLVSFPAIADVVKRVFSSVALHAVHAPQTQGHAQQGELVDAVVAMMDTSTAALEYAEEQGQGLAAIDQRMSVDAAPLEYSTAAWDLVGTQQAQALAVRETREHAAAAIKDSSGDAGVRVEDRPSRPLSSTLWWRRQKVFWWT